ncbi:MAG: hypothetical protein N2109_08610 [Fimbriimonadales bacterium]|nr:hypothetical protein [Fimbriimonadales bacterium]
MRTLTALILLSALIASGCGPQGASEETANRISEMEKRINEQQLKENPPPPGEGPGN